VLGHSDGSVTAIYNRYGYVKEMRRALEQWANDLARAPVSEQPPSREISRHADLMAAVAVKGFLDTGLWVMNSVRQPTVGSQRSDHGAAERAI
jgi:hypothetical protein